MSISSDIISMLNTALESYAPIVIPPTDDDMVRLSEAILTTLYSIYLGDNAGCPSELILTDAAFKCSLVTTVRLDHTIGAFKSYNPSIGDDTTDRLRKNMEQ